MSELKATRIKMVYNGEVYDDFGTEPCTQFYYIKSEADKVIADLKNEIEVQKRLRDTALASVPNVLKVMKIIQHHKYKRCLDNAAWCHNQREIYESNSYNWELESADVSYLREKANIMRKWRKRWLELAEKFKEDV